MATIGEIRKITIGGNTYTIPVYDLPIASSSTLGGVKVGTGLSIDDSTGVLTASDTKVTQTYATASGYTYWRPLVVGYSSGSIETFNPSTVTNTTYTFNTIKVQPSTGTIRFGAAALYNGSYTTTISADTLTAARTLTAPDKSGTIALTSDIKSLTFAMDTTDTKKLNITYS